MRRVLTRALAGCLLLASVAACERAADEADAEPAAPVAAEDAAGDSTPGDGAAPAVPADPAEAPATPGTLEGETATAQPASPLASSPAEVPRMPVQEASSRVRNGEVILVDVRDAESFGADHITGAVNIPLDEVAARAGELPRDKVIVTYCA